MNKQKNILVIRHGALGDIICTLGAFKAIRQHHPDAKISVVTAQPYVDLLRKTGYFDDVYIDNRQSFLKVSKWWNLRSWFRRQNFDMVYDLQTSKRTAMYYKLFGPGVKPNWSGIAPGCSHPQVRPDREKLHIYDRFIDQLKIAGINEVAYPDFDWLEVDVSRFNLPQKYIVLIPGCSANAEYKRWPAQYYGQLASKLLEWGYTPVVIGGPDEKAAVAQVLQLCPQAIDLSGKTSIFDIVGVARGAAAIIGNDTGPSHIAAVTRRPTLMLFSGQHYTPRIVPQFKETTYIENNPLTELSVDRVAAHLEAMLQSSLRGA